PVAVDAGQLGRQLCYLLFQLWQALSLPGDALQVAAGNPYGITIGPAHLAVVALAAEQLDLLPGTECADDAVTVGRATAHVAGQAIADPARAGGGLLGLGWQADGQQAAQQTGAERGHLQRGKGRGTAV